MLGFIPFLLASQLTKSTLSLSKYGYHYHTKRPKLLKLTVTLNLLNYTFCSLTCRKQEPLELY
jgi:hypothetical protein